MELLKQIIQSPTMSLILMGLVGSIGFALKDAPSKILKFLKTKVVSRFIFTANIFEYDDLFKILEKWLSLHHQTQYRDVVVGLSDQKNSHYTFASKKETIRKVPDLILKQAPNIFIFTRKGKKIFIQKKEQILSSATSFNEMFGYTYVLYGYRAKEEILDLLRLVTKEHYKGIGENAVIVRTHDNFGEWQESSVVNVKPLDKVILRVLKRNQITNTLEPYTKEEIIKDVRSFLSDKDWYLKNSIPYKRAYAWEGPPGTGKTSLSLGMAALLKRDVYIINFNSLTDDAQLNKLFRGLTDNSLLLLEDIDTIFVKRENKSGGKISFSALLNCLDGAFYREGLITCITTNNIELLDAALLREGRVDMQVHVGYPAVEQINEFLSQFYEIDEKIFGEYVNEALPMSAVQGICIRNRYDNKKAKREIIKNLNAQHEAVLEDLNSN